MSKQTLELPSSPPGNESGEAGDEESKEVLRFKESEDAGSESETGSTTESTTEGEEKKAQYPKIPCGLVNTQKCPAVNKGVPDASKAPPEEAKTCPYLRQYSCPYLAKSSPAAAQQNPELAKAIKEIEAKHAKEKSDYETRLKELEKREQDRTVEAAVKKLAVEGHIFPKQEEEVKNLAMKAFAMDPSMLGDLTAIFQRQELVPVGKEKGQQETKKEGEEFSSKDDARIRHEQGIDQLEIDRGVKKRKIENKGD